MSGSGIAFANKTLDLAVEGATVYGRDDLAKRLTGARHLLSGSSATVYVVGEFKQGKSSLVNGLVGHEVCPVDDDVATAVPTRVSWSEHEQARAVYESIADEDEVPWIEDVPVDQVAAYVTEHGNPGNQRRLRSMDVGIDRELLGAGLTLVDTPGVGGLGSVHHAMTLGSLPRAHAVMFVSDASQELSAAEVKFLHSVKELCTTLLLVLTKVDLYPEWPRIRELNENHLKKAGVGAEIFPVSSALRRMATESNDTALDSESGFSAVVDWVSNVVDEAERLAFRALGGHVLSVVDRLESPLRSRVVALEAPGRQKTHVDELTRTQRKADELRDRSSRWQQTLFDGFADLGADIDFDLRQRSRTVLHEAEKTIDEGNPAKDWEAFEQWLRQRLAAEAMENYAVFTRRARELAQKVGEQFDLAADQAAVPTSVLAPVDTIDDIEVDSSFSVAPKWHSGGMGVFQRAYGGFMMFTILTHFASIALPFGTGIGLALLMGKLGLNDERKRQVERRRSEAKTAVRRFVDDFNIQVGKDSRDATRRVERDIRDTYSSYSEELRRSISDALDEAGKALSDDDANADELERLRFDLETLAKVRGRAREMMAHAGRGAVDRTADESSVR